MENNGETTLRDKVLKLAEKLQCGSNSNDLYRGLVSEWSKPASIFHFPRRGVDRAVESTR